MTDSAIPMRPFAKSLPMALLQARETTMRSFRPMLAHHGLTEQQWRVLRALAAAPNDGLQVSRLADQTFLLGPSLSRILAGLERKGLVTRLVVVSDQRRARISLTPKAVDLVRRIAPQSEERYGEIEAKLGPDRYQALLTMLNELAQLELLGALPEQEVS